MRTQSDSNNKTPRKPLTKEQALEQLKKCRSLLHEQYRLNKYLLRSIEHMQSVQAANDYHQTWMYGGRFQGTPDHGFLAFILNAYRIDVPGLLGFLKISIRVRKEGLKKDMEWNERTGLFGPRMLQNHQEQIYAAEDFYKYLKEREFYFKFRRY